MAERIYFDNSATTPLDRRVRAAMAPYADGEFGNPSSLYAEGRAARAAVEAARGHVAALVGAGRGGVIFTGGGTEANNLALQGVMRLTAGAAGHVVVSAIEHPAILEPVRWLARQGVQVSVVGVDPEGLVNPEDVAGAIRPDTQLVSIMAANNVIGTLQPVREIGAICRARGVLFHTDAVQAAGKVPLDLQRDNIDLLSLSGHKLHGPKGVGALVVRAGLNLEPLLLGGGQERGLRSGTENVAGIVGLGAAARLALAEGGDVIARLVQLRERLIAGVLRAMPEAYLIGDRYRRLPGHACLGLAGLEGESIKVMLALDEAGIAVSTGSACSTHQAAEPSYVLRAMGFDAFRARGALRITLGRQNTEAEVERFLDILPGVVAALRPIASRLVPSMGVTQ